MANPVLDWRGVKDAARQVVHDHFSLPAVYYPPGVSGAGAGQPIRARVHDKWEIAGDLTGTNFRFGEMMERMTALVLWAEEVHPERDATVTTERNEVFRIEVVEPRDGVTYTALVRRIEPPESSGYPGP